MKIINYRILLPYVLESYINALKWGAERGKYVYESLPRLLSLWLEEGAALLLSEPITLDSTQPMPSTPSSSSSEHFAVPSSSSRSPLLHSGSSRRLPSPRNQQQLQSMPIPTSHMHNFLERLNYVRFFVVFFGFFLLFCLITGTILVVLSNDYFLYCSSNFY